MSPVNGGFFVKRVWYEKASKKQKSTIYSKLWIFCEKKKSTIYCKLWIFCEKKKSTIYCKLWIFCEKSLVREVIHSVVATFHVAM